MSLEVHPAAELIPPMTDEEYQELLGDIRENGFDPNRPIVLYEGKILDGRHREKACDELGITPVRREHEGNDPVGYAISANIHRRHLTTAQRALIALERLPHHKKEARQRRRDGQEKGRRVRAGLVPADTVGNQSKRSGISATDTAGAEVGVAGSTVRDLQRVASKDSAMFEQIRTGGLKINTALRKLEGEDVKRKVPRLHLKKELGKRDTWVANKAIERINTLSGRCSSYKALPGVQAELAARLTTEDEVKGWIHNIQQGERALREFRKRLEETIK